MTTNTATTDQASATPGPGDVPGSAPQPGSQPGSQPGPQPGPNLAPESSKPPLRFWLTLLELCAFGALGLTLFAFVSALFFAGLGGLLLLGLGLVLLVATLYAIWAISWFEIARVDGLYELGVPSLTWATRRREGFLGWLGSLPRQAISGRMWAAFANFFISSVLGVIVLSMARSMVSSVAIGFAGGPWWEVLWGIIIPAAIIFGLVLLSRIISLAIIRTAAREAELREAADRANASARDAGAWAERAGVQAQTAGAQREGAVRAAELERERIERDLHDGVQPRLVSVGMTLGLAQEKIDSDPAAAKELVQEAHTSTKAAITELRQLARGIYASVLDDRGLDAALSALAARSHVPVTLDVRMDGRASKEAETAVYFAIAESLTNAAKHSRASEARVTVRLRGEAGSARTLWARVEDNGTGGATITPGGGLDGMTNRVAAAGGDLRLESPQGGPTALEVSIPCAS